MSITKKVGIVAVACLLTSGAAYAKPEKADISQTVDKKEFAVTGRDQLRISAQTYIRTGYAVSYAKRQLLSSFNRIDITGGGVSEEDYKLQKQINTASRRGYAMLKWMKNDLDGDGAVTREEIGALNKSRANRPLYHQGVQIELTEEQVKVVLAKIIDKLMKDDVNKDGKITYAEAAAASKTKRKVYKPSKFNLIKYTRKVPLSLDTDKDGKVSKAEFEKEVETLLKEIDADKDGNFSLAEVNGFNQTVYEIKRMLK